MSIRHFFVLCWKIYLMIPSSTELILPGGLILQFNFLLFSVSLEAIQSVLSVSLVHLFQRRTGKGITVLGLVGTFAL